MESILLCGLALTGLNTSNNKDHLKINKKQKLDDSYGTNISDKMNKIEKIQANNLKKSILEKKPEFHLDSPSSLFKKSTLNLAIFKFKFLAMTKA